MTTKHPINYADLAAGSDKAALAHAASAARHRAAVYNIVAKHGPLTAEETAAYMHGDLVSARIYLKALVQDHDLDSDGVLFWTVPQGEAA